MLILASTSDKIQVITGAALAATVVHASWVDNSSGTITPGRTNSSFSTAATNDAVAAPGASTYRNIRFLSVRNTNSSAQTITVQHTDGTTAVILWYGVLAQNESVAFDESGKATVFNSGGRPMEVRGAGALYNFSTANQGAGFSSDTYCTGSNILIPAQGLRAGSIYSCELAFSKTAAGTATPIINLRFGTAGTTSDTSRGTYTFSAGTAATDQFRLRIRALFRSVGSGTSAVIASHCEAVSQPTTGFSSLLKGIWQVSSGFDSTVANSGIGVSVNGGASASWTLYQVIASLENV